MDKNIPILRSESTPDQIYGMLPEGENHVLDEFYYPDYPDFPSPEPGNRWEYNNDPLIHDDEQDLRQERFEPEDPLSPWRESHIPQR